MKRGRLSGVSQLRPMDDTEEKINVTESQPADVSREVRHNSM